MSGERRKSRGQISLVVLTVFLAYFLDQISKFCVVNFLSEGAGIPVIKNFLHVTLVYNTGAAFGMFSSYPYLFVAVAFLSVFVIGLLFMHKHHKLILAEKLALALILAGTLGNLTDRLRVGYVIDFIDLRVWPVFNFADSFITVGAAILVWSVFVSGIGMKRKGDSR